MGGIGDLFKSDEQNVSAKTSPWKPSKPYLKDIMSEAEGLYQGDRPEYFPGDTVADFSPYQEQALGLTADRALAGSPLVGQAGGFYGDLLGGDYMNAPGGGYQTGALDAWNPANPYMVSLMGEAGGTLPGTDYWSSVMGGDYLNANPYLDEMYASASRPMVDQWRDEILPGVSGSMAASGRFGSPAHQRAMENSQDALATGLGDLSNRIYGENYARERGMQQGAAGALDANRMQQLGLGGNLAAGYGGMAGQDLSRQLGASGMLSGDFFSALNQRQAAAQGSIPIANQDYMDLAQLMQAGSFEQLQAQNEIDADKARWDFSQTGPGSDLAALEAYMNFITGAGSGGGTSAQNVYGPSNFENWSNIINSGVSVVGS